MNLNLRIHHIGYAVIDVDEAINKFKFLGYTIHGKKEDLSRNVKIIFAEKDGYSIELISPLCTEKPSPVDLILKKNGAIPYHICYEVDNIQETCAVLKKERYLVISDLSPAQAINNRNVIFLYNTTIGIIELVETNGNEKIS